MFFEGLKERSHDKARHILVPRDYPAGSNSSIVVTNVSAMDEDQDANTS
jgi:hypothetical protein